MDSTDAAIRFAELASGLAIAAANLKEAERPIDRRVAAAYLDGMCSAAHRLGLGMTETHVRTAVAEATRSMTRRPPAATAQRAAWQEIWSAFVLRAITGVAEG